ncbi:hypothetical protein [Brevundimonas bacteroides]|uniref:hypothetical protein n=1 Tax=Brevundimonas bacteroides TaxID=74311 RepID=UPI000496D0CA|nr:hypothetical protein [Brevundimonas bacteroides]
MTRSILNSLALAALTTLAACATPSADAPPNSYRADLDRLTADCRERGGILTPTGATTGRPETEYACRITGATRLN